MSEISADTITEPVLVLRLDDNTTFTMGGLSPDFSLVSVGQTARVCGYFCNNFVFIPYDRIRSMMLILPSNQPTEIKITHPEGGRA